MALFGFTVIFIFIFLHEQCSAIDFATARDDATAEEQQIAACYKNCGATGCDERPTITTCDEDEKFRRIDGTCNNIDHPYMGAARTHYDRLMTPPKYEENSTEFLRTTGPYGDLPCPRDISNKMTSVVIDEDLHNGLTLCFMTFGQFIAHDIIRTPSADGGFCCPNGVNLISSNPNCLPIKIPDNDPHFEDNVKCHKFIRSLPDGIRSCETGFREQLDGVTQFIDGSAIYGSSQGVEDALRDPTNGKLLHSDNGDEGTNSCNAANPENKYCHLPSYQVGTESFFAAGDNRVLQNPGMTSITTVFVRFHNFISDKFKALGIVDREENYQQARRIVGACFHGIVYGEYLPFLLGQPIMSQYGLKLLYNEYSYNYNEDSESPIYNEFSTASFRFGHSQAPGEFELARGLPDLELGDHFEDFLVTQQQDQFPSDIIQGTVKLTNSYLVDQFLEPSVTNTLFGNRDLYSANIKRGREHGIPPYMEVRNFCGLETANTWEELENLGIIKPVALALLRNVYQGPDEIDLFPGGVSEEHVDNGVVGPTFACIIGETFQNLKQKDRFFFDAKHNPYRFTKNQLQIIKKTTIASIICEFTTNLVKLKKNAFLLDNADEIDCDILRQGTVLEDISEFLIDFSSSEESSEEK